MFIIAYKRHGDLNCEAHHIGPFKDHDAAYEYLCKLPAIGHAPEGVRADGFKYIIELQKPDDLTA